jgi:toxic protein SymE
MQELAINKPYRHLTVGYFRKRHEDRNTKIPKRYSVHAALSLKGDWLERQGLPLPGASGVEHGKIVIELMSEDAS